MTFTLYFLRSQNRWLNRGGRPTGCCHLLTLLGSTASDPSSSFAPCCSQQTRHTTLQRPLAAFGRSATRSLAALFLQTTFVGLNLRLAAAFTYRQKTPSRLTVFRQLHSEARAYPTPRGRLTRSHSLPPATC